MRTDVREVFAAAASAYGLGNPLLVLERPATQAVLPVLAGRDVLDLGAGRGHYAAYARARGARVAVGLDVTVEMVLGMTGAGVVGDAQQLPLRPECLDVVIAALLASYVPDRAAMFAEVARVLRPGGCLVLSDLHPVASDRGWTRSFVASSGELLKVAAEPPTLPELEEGIEGAGLCVEVRDEPVIDERLEPAFRRAGRRDYRALEGTPLLVVLRARKRAR